MHLNADGPSPGEKKKKEPSPNPHYSGPLAIERRAINKPSIRLRRESRAGPARSPPNIVLAPRDSAMADHGTSRPYPLRYSTHARLGVSPPREMSPSSVPCANTASPTSAKHPPSLGRGSGPHLSRMSVCRCGARPWPVALWFPTPLASPEARPGTLCRVQVIAPPQRVGPKAGHALLGQGREESHRPAAASPSVTIPESSSMRRAFWALVACSPLDWIS